MHIGLSTAFILISVPIAASCQRSASYGGQRTRSAQPTQGMGMDHGIMAQGMNGGMMRGSYVRHHVAMANGIPEPYRSMRDPLSDTAATLEQGARIYQQDCAACHGSAGRGDGPAGEQLNPPAANLAWLSHMPLGQSDPYLYWTVAEGGQQFGTAMPSFKGALSPNDRWAVVDYLRHGLPQHTGRK